jgi:hypothetical protein
MDVMHAGGFRYYIHLAATVTAHHDCVTSLQCYKASTLAAPIEVIAGDLAHEGHC